MSSNIVLICIVVCFAIYAWGFFLFHAGLWILAFFVLAIIFFVIRLARGDD
jgi:hypothetical protein